MRFVFTDEGGISRCEPFVVVAGIVVHADDKLIPLENELERLVEKHIPKEHQKDFVFHATNIWSGTGKIFKDREQWPLTRRLKILRDLARVPKKLGLYIVYEYVERAKLDLCEVIRRADGAERAATNFEHQIAAHAIAFSACTLRIEQLMRHMWPDEVAQLVAEDNDQVRAIVKRSHDAFRDPSKADMKIVPNTILTFAQDSGFCAFS